eukprot:scaffold14713_cov131-Isochrysis_galbana.AAC.1
MRRRGSRWRSHPRGPLRACLSGPGRSDAQSEGVRAVIQPHPIRRVRFDGDENSGRYRLDDPPQGDGRQQVLGVIDERVSRRAEVLHTVASDVDTDGGQQLVQGAPAGGGGGGGEGSDEAGDPGKDGDDAHHNEAHGEGLGVGGE